MMIVAIGLIVAVIGTVWQAAALIQLWAWFVAPTFLNHLSLLFAGPQPTGDLF